MRYLRPSSGLKSYFILPGLLISTLALPQTAFAKTVRDNGAVSQTLETSALTHTQKDISDIFKPNPSDNTHLDFQIWSDWLVANVFFMGPSRRVLSKSRLSPSARVSGSRFIQGHRSRNIFEGNKVPYGTLHPDHKAFLADYQADLETLSTTLDITTLSRNDQLAYWFNLHNVALINNIAAQSLIRRPNRITPIKGSSETLQDAKIVTVAGHKLSLRDIREKIVYPNWQDSVVIYGFHTGVLGSPNISITAFDAENVRSILEYNAGEFTNSLRGYKDGKISSLYKEVSPYFFDNDEAEIRAHFKRFQRPELFAELSSYEKLKWQKPNNEVADLAGGARRFAARNVFTSSLQEWTTFDLPYVRAFAIAQAENLMNAREKGWLPPRGVVTIEEIETSTDFSSNPEVR